MNHQPVESKLIKSVGYDEDLRHLQVKFHNGSTYEYSDVPPNAHADLVIATSVGRHFNEHISGKYPHRRVS
jgi:hypothetical protein